jgi:hypothetical protein
MSRYGLHTTLSYYFLLRRTILDNEEYDRFEEFMAKQEGLTKKNPAAIPTEQPVDLFVVIPDNDVLQTKESP